MIWGKRHMQAPIKDIRLLLVPHRLEDGRWAWLEWVEVRGNLCLDELWPTYHALGDR